MKRILIVLLLIMTLSACNGTADTVSKSKTPSSTMQTEEVSSINNNDDTSDTNLSSENEETDNTVSTDDTVSDTSNKACEHTFFPNGCLSPELCSKCGATNGVATGHSYKNATCTTPKKCIRCGEKSGQPLGHDYSADACTTTPKCKRCGITGGEALGHKWSTEKCERCKVSIKNLASNGEKINIACVGDSITFNGYWKNNLFENLPEYYNVSGFGVNGSTGLTAGIDVGSPKAYINQSAYKNSCDFAPNAVVIMLGTNDSKPCNWNKIQSDNGAQYISDIIALIESYQALSTEPRVFLALPPTAFSGSTNYEGINNSTIENGIIPLLKKAANATGAIIIDTHEATKNSSAHFKDGVHPSDDQGRETLAKAVADAIKNIYIS